MSFSRPVMLLACLLAVPVLAQNAPQEPKAPGILSQIPFNPDVKTGTLANGMKYYIMRNAKPEQRVELRLAVNAGSVLETDEQQGLAHFVEHMAFNGTKNFKKDELIRYLESIGTRFGADLNAYTSFDETVYMLQLPTDKPDLLHKGFLILSDWAHGVSFDGEEIDKERGVILEEMRLGKGAAQRLRDRQLPVVFHGSRYAERLPIGKEKVLRSFAHETLRSFYREWYRPDLMAVIVVGDIEIANIEKQIEEHFGKIPKPDAPLNRPVITIPDHEETLYSIETDPEATGTSVTVMYKHDPKPNARVADYRRILLESLYGQMLNQRLSELLQKGDPPFIGAFVGYGRMLRAKDAYRMMAQVENSGVIRGLEAVLTEAARVRLHGFTESELERTKTDVLRGYEERYNERDKTNSDALVGEFVQHFLTGEPSPGLAMEYAMAKKYVPTITVKEINERAAEMISDKNIVITLSGPKKEDVSLPSREELAAVFERVKTKTITPYIDAISNKPLVDPPVTKGSIVNETRDEKLGLTMWTLSNGVRVVLKPTDFKNDEILLTAFSPGGSSLAPAKDYYSASMASTLLDGGGLADFDAVTLRKMLAGKVVNISPFMSEEFEGLSGSAAPKDLETLFQLIYLTMTAPRKDTAVFQSMKKRFSSMLENMRAMPEMVFRDTVSVTMAQYHPLRRSFTKELLNEIDLDVAERVYKERFADAGDFTFLFIGNVSPDALKPLAEQWLATLPSKGRKEVWKDLGVEMPKSTIEKTVRRGMEKKSTVIIFFNGSFEPTQQNRYDLTSLEELLTIKLREAIREEKGGSYGVSVNIGLSRLPKPEYQVSVSFGCSPDRVDELVSTAFEVLKTVSSEGASDEDLGKIKEMQRREREKNLKENSFWMGRLQACLMNGDDPHEILKFDDLVNGLTSDALKRTAKKVLTLDRYQKFILLPEETK